MTLTRPLPTRRDPALTPSLERFLERAAARTDRALARLLPPKGAGPAPQLAAAMRYAVLPGGKRLRPALTLLAFRAAGGRGQGATFTVVLPRPKEAREADRGGARGGVS